MKRLLLFLFSLGILSSCSSHMEYDISGGINKEMTLFQEEITVPL